MGERKACFNEKCSAYKKRTKHKDEAYVFCPICATELIVVCKSLKCYEQLPNPLEKYCDECLQKQQEQRDKMVKAVKTVPNAAVTIAAATPTIIKATKDIIKFLPK